MEPWKGTCDRPMGFTNSALTRVRSKRPGRWTTTTSTFGGRGGSGGGRQDAEVSEAGASKLTEAILGRPLRVSN
eukprot:15457802-Alexandrium_andersonii.AAC.1